MNNSRNFIETFIFIILWLNSRYVVEIVSSDCSFTFLECNNTSQLELAGVSWVSCLYYPQTDLLFLSPLSHSTSLHELMTSESLYPTVTLCCNQDVNTASNIVDNTIWMFHAILKPVHLQLGSLILPREFTFVFALFNYFIILHGPE